MVPAVSANSLRTCPGTIRTGDGDHLYLDYATCAMTHVSGTSGHVNRPANMNHACSSQLAMTHIGWDRTLSKRRGQGEDSIYWDASKNRFVGAVSLGFSPAGTRIRKKVTGRTKTEVRDKLRDCLLYTSPSPRD